MANVKHLLLDVNVIIDLWLGVGSEELTQEIFDLARKKRVKLWIPAASIATIDYVAKRAFKQRGVPPEEVGSLIANLMDDLFQVVEILSNHGFEQKEVYEKSIDYEDGQIASALRSLRDEPVCVVSEDSTFDHLGEVSVKNPMEALTWLYRESSDDQQAALPFINLSAQQALLRPQIEQGIENVLRHGQYIMGPEVAELEQKLCDFTEAKHCITCASGTDALLMVLMALEIGPGDEVITSPFTFVATGEVISLVGATPVFVDIDPRTFNIDPSKIAAAITNKTRAIIPVSLFGLTADMDAVGESVDRSSGEDRESLIVNRSSGEDRESLIVHRSSGENRESFIVHRSSEEFKQDDQRSTINDQPAFSDQQSTINNQPSFSDQQSTINNQRIFIIEDAAQSFGATYKGRKSCNLSTLACTSFFPAKPLGCYGDGGAIFTDNDELAEVLRSIRIHGKGSDKYDNIRIGINGRLDTLQAAILLPKLEIFPAEIEARQKAADIYTRLFSELNDSRSTINDLQPLPDQQSTINDQRVLTPFVPLGQTSAWAQYSILVTNQEQRDNLQKHLSKAGVPTAVYYPKPLHLQTAYASLGYKTGDFPVAEDVAQRIVSLPMGPYVTEKDQGRVVEAVSKALDR